MKTVEMKKIAKEKRKANAAAKKAKVYIKCPLMAEQQAIAAKAKHDKQMQF